MWKCQIKILRLIKMPEHFVENRPWGSYEILSQFEVIGDGLKDTCVKILKINPNAKLSYQSHKYRNEHWFVVQGEGFVILDGKTVQVRVGSSIDIPIGTKHRVVNSSNEIELKIVEAYTGHYDEKDILRFEDDYGRA